MIRRIAIFVGLTLAAGAALYVPAALLTRQPPPLVVAVAALVCIVPGLVVLGVAYGLREKPPEAKIVGVLFATLFRMIGAVAGGVLASLALPRVQEEAASFIGWGVVFYILTLLIESRLLYIDSSDSSCQGPRSQE